MIMFTLKAFWLKNKIAQSSGCDKQDGLWYVPTIFFNSGTDRQRVFSMKYTDKDELAF